MDMNEAWLQLLSQAPAAAAVVYVVILFLRHMRERDVRLLATMAQLDQRAGTREERILKALTEAAAAMQVVGRRGENSNAAIPIAAFDGGTE